MNQQEKPAPWKGKAPLPYWQPAPQDSTSRLVSPMGGPNWEILSQE